MKYGLSRLSSVSQSLSGFAKGVNTIVKTCQKGKTCDCIYFADLGAGVGGRRESYYSLELVQERPIQVLRLILG